jgi:hypothetical protein
MRRDPTEPRDPARIATVLRVIERVWERQPDMRLGQLLGNLRPDGHPGLDLYWLEDDDLLEELMKLYGEVPWT